MIVVDIASIMIACVAANHLGLISAIESITGLRLYVINCPKCFTFWATLAYGIDSQQDILPMLAVSFFCAYLAIWLELGMGMIDYLYNKVYEKIYADYTDNPPATDPDKGDSPGKVSEL